MVSFSGMTFPVLYFIAHLFFAPEKNLIKCIYVLTNYVLIKDS